MTKTKYFKWQQLMKKCLKKKIANVHNLASVLVSKMDVVYAIKKWCESCYEEA